MAPGTGTTGGGPNPGPHYTVGVTYEKEVISVPSWEGRLASVPLQKNAVDSLVLNYLLAEGYTNAAREFSHEIGRGLDPRYLHFMNDRARVRTTLLNGDIDEAVAMINALDPEILDRHPQLCFRLKQQKLIELIREGKSQEALAFAHRELAPLGMRNKELQQELEQTISLLIFGAASPSADLLEYSRRESTADMLNETVFGSDMICMESCIPLMLKYLCWTQIELGKYVAYPAVYDLDDANLELPKSDDERAKHSWNNVSKLAVAAMSAHRAAEATSRSRVSTLLTQLNGAYQLPQYHELPPLNDNGAQADQQPPIRVGHQPTASTSSLQHQQQQQQQQQFAASQRRDEPVRVSASSTQQQQQQFSQASPSSNLVQR